jgi:Protein of unknown function (DUF2778)
MIQDDDKTARPEVDLDAFAWTYSQQTGELQHDGTRVATGYSGSGEGKNNPQLERAPNVGPIPAGDWTISGPPANTAEHGPYVLKLNPSEETETFGRDGFLMHGDSKEHPGAASKGCVILPRSAREQVWNSGDRDLEVVPNISLGEPAQPLGQPADRISATPGVKSPDKA